jgi:predicted glycosyltransferase
MKVWIDLSNSPHPLLFAPIARRLDELGHAVLVTARDNAQTLELAREHWPDLTAIGSPSPRGRAAKAVAVGQRIRDLRRWAGSSRPQIALSHNSYAQISAAYSLSIPIVTGMDYEHQPANHLAFRLADRILLPEALPLEAVRRQGASARKVVRYPGLKEELYLGDFDPDLEILSKLGIDRAGGKTVVVTRTPPSGAMYHQFDNPTFERVLTEVASRPRVHCVVLARHPAQQAALAARRLPNCTVPGHAVDSRSLLSASDLFVGAGGTMTREAALLGIPTISVYAGRPGAVEGSLIRQGKILGIDSLDERIGVARPHEPRPVEELQQRAQELIGLFVRETLAVGS